MLMDYKKLVLSESKNCIVNRSEIVNKLNKLCLGNGSGRWVLGDDDFIFFDNNDDSDADSSGHGVPYYEGDDHLEKLSLKLSKHIHRGWIEISNIGHEGHEFVWYELIRIHSNGSVTQANFNTGPGLVTNVYNETDSYFPISKN